MLIIRNTLDQGNLIAHMWPSSYPVLEHARLWELRADEVLPESLEDQLEWAHVRRNPERADPSRRYILVHTAAVSLGSALRKVVLRVQGAVLKANLQTTGNWKR